ncbi:hypothetical protein WDZ17_00100 [Pseudokineococcus basanitobsidens]|uniref:Transcriptional regulator with AbiEi antitoxin domain of type IV toxin-antitoxin system n=1 Tax=Pseudokineococcus basanitobsidens TaxID=1926649 RepID=A0ABU8RF63_9ACTN
MDEALVVDALHQIGLQTSTSEEGHGAQAPDVVVHVGGGAPIAVEVKRRSLVTDDDARRLAAAPPPTGGVLLVVADRVTAPARKVLSAPGLGYLDLRGHLALRTDQVLVDTDITPVQGRAARKSALSGKAGLEVATALLLRPERQAAVRALARELGRAPSTVSDVLGALRRDGLLDGGAVERTDLFWQVAEHWPTQRSGLARPPSPTDVGVATTLRLGLATVGQEAGWALTDSAAAAAYGAPLAFRSGQVHDFVVPDPAVVRRAVTLLGSAAPGGQAVATVRAAPVPAAAVLRSWRGDGAARWPLAHPLFVALDLAQDAGRGREVLEAWIPDGQWPRAW